MKLNAKQNNNVRIVTLHTLDAVMMQVCTCDTVSYHLFESINKHSSDAKLQAALT